MYKRFTINGDQKFVKILPELINIYNNKIHSSIKVSPNEASKNPELIKQIVNDNNYYNILDGSKKEK